MLKRRLVCLAALVVAAGLLAPLPLAAKTSLGSQRVGTSSASFLRIGIGARPASMGGAFVAICDDITACAWNPAGLVHLTSAELAVNYIDLPADITYSHICYGLPLASLDGTIAVQFGSLSTSLEETQEYYPYGTGRDFTFSDWLFGVSVGKRFTDKFSGGIAAKYVREDLGTEVGGPTTNAFVLDAGTQYEIGPKNMRMGVALMNFGPDFIPGGNYKRKTQTVGSDAKYQGFAPSTEFRFGVAFDPLTRPYLTSVADIELVHPADNAETIRVGGEVVLLKTLALRGGYDLNADELKASFGMGVSTRIFSREASLDYGAALSTYLGTVHRFSLAFKL
jgi:hypothetical protein